MAQSNLPKIIDSKGEDSQNAIVFIQSAIEGSRVGNYRKTARVRIKLDLARMSSEEKQARARAVYEHLKDSPEFPDPTLDLEVFKEATDSHAAALVEVLDGSRSAFAEKNRSETVLGEMLRTLARYVESKCVGNIQRALASGFDVVSNDKRNRATPVSEKIRKIWVGDNSGQAWVRLVADPEAYAYQLRWRPEEDLADDAWTSLPVANTRPATLINDLIRGKTYVFEVRAVLHLGYTDWSGRVTWTAV